MRKPANACVRVRERVCACGGERDKKVHSDMSNPDRRRLNDSPFPVRDETILNLPKARSLISADRGNDAVKHFTKFRLFPLSETVVQRMGAGGFELVSVLIETSALSRLNGLRFAHYPAEFLPHC